MQYLYTYLGTLLILDLFYVSVFHFRFGKALPLAYITAALTAFVCSYLGGFSLLHNAFVAECILSVVVTILLLIFKKIGFKELCGLYFRLSAVAFIAFFIYFFYVASNTQLSQTDDFVRWAGKVRDALRNDVLYTDAAKMFVPSDIYPPFSTLLEVIGNKFLGGYNESWSIFGLSTFLFSLVVPYLDHFSWKIADILKALISSATVLTVLLTISYDQRFESNWTQFAFNTTFVDWLVAILLGYGFYCVYDFRNTIGDWVSFSLISTALMLSDRISLVYAFLLVVTLCFTVILKGHMNRKTAVCYFLFSIIIPAAFYLFWRSYVSPYNTYLQTHLISTQPKVYAASVRAFSEPRPALSDFQKTVFMNFIQAIFTIPVYYHPFKLAFGPFVIGITLILCLLTLLKKEKKELFVIAVFFFLGALGHLLTMAVAYLYKFTPYEAEHLASFQRYCATYSLSGMVLLAGVLLDLLHDRIWKTAIIFGLFFLFIEPASISTIKIGNIEDSPYYMERTRFIEYYEKEYHGEKTLIVNENDPTLANLLRYLYDLPGKGNIKTIKVEDSGNLDTFLESLQNYDYLFVAGANEYFYTEYWMKITDVDCWNMTIYTIVHNEDGSVSLALHRTLSY